MITQFEADVQNHLLYLFYSRSDFSVQFCKGHVDIGQLEYTSGDITEGFTIDFPSDFDTIIVNTEFFEEGGLRYPTKHLNSGKVHLFKDTPRMKFVDLFDAMNDIWANFTSAKLFVEYNRRDRGLFYSDDPSELSLALTMAETMAAKQG